ncbi:sterol desaturase family protein [Pandoraea nosoerga]|uniref:Fatty acid hydroxylase n=1 Tax=Pandoraea nosoerga TaxID=2508296 RepID=A0A5E4VH02_9BURK|nr:sterol desaturase family protein [Pandoraea nosoerga]MBN4668140.1 sterol desaturase family protein [Pandoraea nosoerga]MBN4678005.1 sterol desaturase family protein [Pandoraea nosoerga]MBN4682852.1 sterol desaturase family protein [Pandoraea nosoerga]MBN4747138.1 sterol desaturase family protein [Pandoraea nosoerga]VVE11326.1 fatty acid hydroxylase [Pandoraea nosoerga]
MFDSLVDGFYAAFSAAQTEIYTRIVQPVLYATGLMSLADDAFDAVQFFLIGVLQIVLMLALLRPLEWLAPAERWRERRAVRVDVIYTLVHRLGLFNLVFFFVLRPLFDALQAWLRLAGFVNVNLEDLWPGVTDHALVSFLVYLLVLDFAGYWYHRWSHTFRWWWALHAVHHSQRQMSFWTDNRNHLLDDLIKAAFFAVIAIVIGVSPVQFVLLVAVSDWLQSLQHTNTRLRFGRLGERLLVSPAFHRRHHAIGVGHEGRHRGCNFGVLFPWWDMALGTADFSRAGVATGIRDQLPPPAGRLVDYGEGFWAQQWLGLQRLWASLRPRPAAGPGADSATRTDRTESA